MGVANLTVWHRELGAEHGLAGGADEQGEFETKPYLVRYGDRGDFINQLAGTTAVSGGVGGRIVQNLPYQLPDNPRLYYRSCTWTCEGELLAPTEPIQYEYAVVLATFRQPNFNYQAVDDPGFLNSLSQDPTENQSLLWATQELDFAKEWMTIPNSSVKFKSDGLVPRTSKGRSVTVVTAVITFHRYPMIPFAVLRQYADSVNLNTFLGCAKGTVFFEGPKTSTEINADGSRAQRLQLTFKWREYDWNKYLRDDGITWDLVVDKAYANGSPDAFCTYTYRNFGNLLKLLNP